MSSEVNLWPTGEVNNQLVYYLTGGFTLVYFMCILITCAGKRNKSNILVLPPNEDIEDENELYKYVITVKTSRRPESGIPLFAKIYLQLIGDKKTSKYQKINIFRSGKLMFQRGGHDMLMFRTKDYLGEIMEVKFVISAGNLKWKAVKIEVMDLLTKNRKTVPYTILHVENKDLDTVHTMYPDNFKEGCCRRCMSLLCVYHHCISPVNQPVRFGAYTTIVNVLLIFFTVTLLLLGTLITQILSSLDNSENFTLEMNHVIYTCVTALGSCLFIAMLEILLRKIKSGRRHYFHKSHQSSSQADDVVVGKELTMKKFGNNFNMHKDGAVATLIQISGKQPTAEMKGPEMALETPYQSILTVTDSKEGHIPVNKSKSDSSEEVMYSCTDFDDPVTNQDASIDHFHSNQDASINHYQSNQDASIDHFHSFVEDQPSVYYQINEEISSCDQRPDILQKGKVEKEKLVKTEDITIEIDKEDGLISSVSLDECPQVVSKIQAGSCMSDTVQYLPDRARCSHLSDYFDLMEQDDQSVIDDDDQQIKKSANCELCAHFSDTLISKTHQHFPSSEIKMHRAKNTNESSWKLRRHDKFISHMKKQRSEELQDFSRTLIKSMDTEIKRLKQLLLDGDIDYSDISLKVGEWCNEIKEQLVLHTTHKEKVASMQDGNHVQHGDSTLTQTLDCIDETSIVKPPQRLLIEDPTMNLKSSKIIKLAINDITCCQEQGISMVGADLEETAYHLSVRIDKFAFDTVQSLKDRKIDETEVKENHTKMKNLELDQAKVVHFYLKKVARLTFQKVGEELEAKEFDSYINEFCLNMMANKKHEINILRQRHLVVWRLCLDAINNAKEELWFEFQDPVNVYSLFLIRQSLLGKLGYFVWHIDLDTDLINELKNTATHLNRSWKKQGFHNWKKTSIYLSEVLLVQYIDEVKKNSTQNNSILVNFEQNVSAMKTLRQKLASTLEKEASSYILNVADRKLKHIIKANQNILYEFLNVQTELALNRFVSCLPDLVKILVENEILNVTAVQLVSEVTQKALHEFQFSVQMNEYKDYDVESMDEEDISGLLGDLKPVRNYLKFVTINEKQKTKRIIQKSFEQDGLKKHEEFAMGNLQSVIDSYHIRDEDQKDDSLTGKFLYELEWELTLENRKPLPHFLKGPLVFLIFCATLLNLIYVTLTGAQLIIAALQEWLVCFLGSLVCFYILECLASIIVGYCDMTH